VRISSLSTVYLTVPVSATRAGIALDLSSDVVEWAFPARGAAPVTWIVGDWAAGLARVLLGPVGGTVLLAGFYDAWLRVTDSPERPVLQVGGFQIT